jgi:hypothetical protein
VPRWAPEAALPQKAQALLRALAPQSGEPVSLIRDDAKQATRGTQMAAIATMQDPTTATSIRGHPDVCGLWRCRPHGSPRDRALEAGGLPVRSLGGLHVVCSRTGVARKSLGLVRDAPDLSAADVIRTDAKGGTIEPWGKDAKPLLGLGQYQHRSARAAVTHRPLVGFADALRPPRRIERRGAQGHRTRHQAAGISTAAAQDQLRRRLWEALITYLTEARPGQPVLQELERLRGA